VVACSFNDTPPVAPAKFLRRTASIPRNAVLAAELTNIDRNAKKKNLQMLDKNLPRSTVILSSSVTVSMTEQSSWVKHPSRLVGIGALPTLLSRELIELSAGRQTEPAALSHVQDFFIKIGKRVSIVQDRVGMVMPRILCMLINEAFFAVMEGVASPQDIDTAMKLGTNYPMGPLEWADKIGLPHVYAVLLALHADLGEERYRIAPLLKQMSTVEKFWQ